MNFQILMPPRLLGDAHKLGMALHIGFLRMSGRLLGAFRVIPVALWCHLGNELGIASPEPRHAHPVVALSGQ